MYESTTTQPFLLAVLAIALGPAFQASGQWGEMERLPAVSPHIDGTVMPAIAPVAMNSPQQTDAGLAQRVADLEAALQKIHQKEAAARAKAAGKPSVTVGGRLYLDWANFSQNPNSILQMGNQQNGVEFRRARLFAKGTAFHVIDYKVQYDFANTQSTAANDKLQATSFRDVFITVKELPYLGHVRVGHFKEPYGLEENTSSKYITFMERALPIPLIPERNVGVMAFNHSWGKNMTWAIGAFTSRIEDDPPEFSNDAGNTALTMRGTFLPWYDEATGGRGLFHLGAAYSFRDIPGDLVWFRARPESHLSDRVVDTGNITDVPDYQLLGLEAALVYGPFSAQSEYMAAFLNRNGFADARFDGYYVYVSYFLTGESRRYNRSRAYFERIQPFENFFLVRDGDGYIRAGRGAWEIAYRYSYLDLDSAGVVGGRVADHTLGLNWYLNPYTRMMWNYVHSDAHRPPAGGGPSIPGAMDIFEMRVQFEF